MNLEKIFSVKNINNHRVINILGIRMKFRILSSYHNINNKTTIQQEFYEIHPENNNKIYIISEGIKSELKHKISGLNIIIEGSNNQIVINMPTNFDKAIIRIASNNSYVEINKSPRFMLNINMWGGNHQKFIFGENSDTSCVGVAHLVDDHASIIIGKDCMLAGEVILWGRDAHAIYDIDTKKVINEITHPLTIGDHCWIGQGSTLTKNASLANNTIVGTHSVVTKVFDEENIIIAGNPAKIIKRNINWSRDSIFYYKLKQSERGDNNA